MNFYSIGIIVVAFFLTFLLSTVATSDPVHKRNVNGIEECACFLINETKLFVVVFIDGVRMGIFKPLVNDNLHEGSAIKIWLSTKPHTLFAFGYSSMENVAANKPSFKTEDIPFNISNHIDKERKTDGSFRIPAISLEEMHFKPVISFDQFYCYIHRKHLLN